ncbi:hypothetical protein [Aporhodopirellula aestuarii]|uniref:Uncharacterized protein n=1 Tax=Aporhodopirellula aestuarii TaxID=2950107 RepID=A0ABT0UDL6_9BACT|nr:hypothetical protein [Aporhodopirellula aestuarii]MCM2374381.1 hypothetical protein [Aporhodopirellula aestuarii]
MTDTAKPTDRADLFSAPRKYDLSTAIVVTTAYAAVFALLRAISFPAMAAFLLVAFFTSVALGQAVLFGAKHPRSASALVGSAFFVIMLIAECMLGQRGRAINALPSMIAFGLFFGAFWGYVGGVIVGSVFMVAHGVRLVLSPRESPPDASQE